MAFDVSKFLALTALIAGTGAACSSTDKDEPAGGAGTSGSAGENSAGKSGNQAGAADAGNGGAAAGSAGEGGGPAAGGAGAGGESLAGGGAGGAPDTGECLGSLALGGAGGAGSGVEPSLEGLCSAFADTVCAGIEDFAPSYKVCAGVMERAQPAVAVAVADCITALSAEDVCDGPKVAACFSKLEGKGCANPDGAAACTAIQAREGCDVINLASCEKIADLVSPDMFQAFTECMDPSIEGWFDTTFTGTCAERLDTCAGVSL
jgi:hypothetical protein